MQKINLDKKIIVFLVLSGFLLVELFVLLPGEIKTISRLNKKINTAVENLKLIEEDWPNKENYLIRKEKLAKEISDMRSRVVAPQEESKAFSFISANSRNFSVTISSLSPGELQDYTLTGLGEFKVLPINVKAESQFHNLLEFLEYLQGSKYLFGVKELEISSGSSSNTINMTLCCLIEKK